MRNVLAVVLMLWSMVISAQEPASEEIAVTLWFRLSEAQIDKTYRDNGKALEELDHLFGTYADRIDSVHIHATSSPDGHQTYNRVLSRRRGETVRTFILSKYAFIPQQKVKLHTTDENTEGLWTAVMADEQVPYRTELLRILQLPISADRKEARIRALGGGAAFNYLKTHHLDDLRTTVVFVAYLRPEPKPVQPVTPVPVVAQAPEVVQIPPTEVLTKEEPTVVEPDRLPRRAVLAVKTNLLLDAAVVPQYGFCPIWNVALEYYPLRGHYTAGASFDFPWWQGNTTNHKYFQIRNYQLEGRRYFRESGEYTGWYASAYAHVGLFAIGFAADKGWVGESVGAGLGAGYVLPLSRNGRWKLEFNLQVGYIRSKYDTYTYGCDVESTDKYYYDYDGNPSLFSKRQHRHNWLGPTRIGITLSYDLLYRPVRKAKGLSLRAWEKGGTR